MKKHFLALLFLCLSSTALAHPPIKSYGVLIRALENGDDVKAIVKMEQCLPKHSKGLKKQRVAMNFDNYLNVDRISRSKLKKLVTTSNSTFGKHYKFGEVIVNRELTIYPNNKADFEIELLQASTRKLVLDLKYHCRLRTRHRSGSISLYNMSL